MTFLMTVVSDYILDKPMENDDCEMMVSEKSWLKVVINGRSLFSSWNNEDESTCH